MRPKFCTKIVPRETREQGIPGARCTRGLVCKSAEQKRTRAYRFSGGNPAFPAQWFTAYFALSPAIGLSCHRRRRCLNRQLDAGVEASGPHDFSVRRKALSSAAPPASTTSRPASVTIASAPLWDETVNHIV